MTDVSNTLAERGARYGAFKDHAAIAQGLQEVLWETPGWYKLQPDVRQMCVVITDKIARILNGDPDYTDNYHDIQGYAKLVEDRLLKEQQAQKGQLFESEEPAEQIQHEEAMDWREEILDEHSGRIPVDTSMHLMNEDTPSCGENRR